MLAVTLRLLMLGLNQEGMRFRTPRTEVGSAQAGQETGKSDREPVGTADNADAGTFRVLEMSNMRSNDFASRAIDIWR